MSDLKKTLDKKLLIGRHEWCQLPELNIPAIKAKIDTGAKTSALHAINIQTRSKGRVDMVYFDVYPIQSNDQVLVRCRAPIIDERYITSSNGHKERRFVILTHMELGAQTWEIELTLSNRDPLRYRMLLGREALNHRALINPAISCHQRKLTSQTVLKIYDALTK